MTLAMDSSNRPRMELRLSRATFSDDLGSFGLRVGPRLGPDKRTTEEKEDWCLRRYLIALRILAEEKFPLVVRAYVPHENTRMPDFVLENGDGEIVGIEVKEATDPEFQRHLTDTEGTGGDFLHMSKDCYVPSQTVRNVVEDLTRALNKGIERFNSHRYVGVPACDLLICENSDGSMMVPHDNVIETFVNAGRDVSVPFRKVHIFREKFLCVDVFGSRRTVAVSGDYDHDFVCWLDEQAHLARAGNSGKLDLPNIAEELEALAREDRRAVGSHIRNILMHLIKWEYQSSHRSRGLLSSLSKGRNELEDLMYDSPSLAGKEFLLNVVRDQYPKARKRAILENKLDSSVIPLLCPFTEVQIFDEDYPSHVELDEA